MVGVGEYISIRLKPAVNLSVFVTHAIIDVANIKNNIYDKINYGNYILLYSNTLFL